MAVQMTRAEYEAKYGTPPPEKKQPIRMTRAEYEAKYGTPPNGISSKPSTFMQRFDTLTQDTAKRLQETSDRYTSGKQSLGSAIFQTGANLVRGATNPITAAALPLFEKLNTNNQTSEAKRLRENSLINRAVNKISDIPAVQKFAQSDKATTLERNVEAVNDYASILPAGKAPAVASTVIQKTNTLATRAGTTLAQRQATAKANAIANLEKSYRSISQSTLPMRRQVTKATTRGKDPIKFLAENGVIPEVVDGKVNSLNQATTLRDNAAPINAFLEQALVEIQPSIPRTDLSLIRSRALKAADELDVTESTRTAIKSDINSEFDLLVQKYGPATDLVTINNIKKTNWKAAPFNSAKPYQKDTSYIIGRAAKDTIEDTVPSDAFSVKELNAYLGDIYEAAAFLDKLDGRAVKGGRLGNYFARGIGAVVGSKAGPLGSILGAYGGDYLAQILQSNTFGSPLKRHILTNLQRQDPAAYQKVMYYLQKSGIERDMRPLLPAPDATKSTINQGRAIPVLPKGNRTDYIGPETVIDPNGGRPGVLPPAQSEPKQLPSTLPDTVPPTSKSSTPAALAGLQTDEEGNIDFNPLAALASAGAVGLAARFFPSKKKASLKTLLTAKNVLKANDVTTKPGAIKRAVQEIKSGKARPIQVRRLPEGGIIIEDGRHRLEAARILGLKSMPIEDVTNKY